MELLSKPSKLLTGLLFNACANGTQSVDQFFYSETYTHEASKQSLTSLPQDTADTTQASPTEALPTSPNLVAEDTDEARLSESVEIMVATQLWHQIEPERLKLLTLR